MEKLSSQERALLFKDAGAALRWADQKITELQEKVAHYERQERARKIASQMDDEMRGGLSVEEKTASILSSQQNLDVLEQAVELRTTDPKLASVGEGDEVENHGNPLNVPPGRAKEAMHDWLLSS